MWRLLNGTTRWRHLPCSCVKFWLKTVNLGRRDYFFYDFLGGLKSRLLADTGETSEMWLVFWFVCLFNVLRLQGIFWLFHSGPSDYWLCPFSKSGFKYCLGREISRTFLEMWSLTMAVLPEAPSSVLSMI